MKYIKRFVGILKSGRVCMERGKTDKEERALLEANAKNPMKHTEIFVGILLASAGQE